MAAAVRAKSLLIIFDLLCTVRQQSGCHFRKVNVGHKLHDAAWRSALKL